MVLKKMIENHLSFNEEEASDQRSFVQFLNAFPEKEWAVRSNLIGHLTSSAWVVNRERNKVLFAYHNIYRSWAWLGGHADGDLDLLHVAQKEAREEAGVLTVRPLLEKPIDISVINVQGHVKKGKFVSPHLHFNVAYLLEADEEEVLQHAPEENADVAWLDMAGLLDKVAEDAIKSIYQRIMDKVKLI